MSSLTRVARRIYVGGGLLCTLAALSCSAISSDKTLVAKATAAYTYHEASYEWACVGHPGPVTCLPCYSTLQDGRKKIKLANEVYKIGKMPKAQVDGLNELVAALEKCP